MHSKLTGDGIKAQIGRKVLRQGHTETVRHVEGAGEANSPMSIISIGRINDRLSSDIDTCVLSNREIGELWQVTALPATEIQHRMS